MPFGPKRIGRKALPATLHLLAAGWPGAVGPISGRRRHFVGGRAVSLVHGDIMTTGRGSPWAARSGRSPQPNGRSVRRPARPAGARRKGGRISARRRQRRRQRKGGGREEERNGYLGLRSGNPTLPFGGLWRKEIWDLAHGAAGGRWPRCMMFDRGGKTIAFGARNGGR